VESRAGRWLTPLRKRLLSAESVTEGHPDKLADQISDAVLDAILAQDPNARVACETLVTTGLIMVAGEISADCIVDIRAIARATVRDVGYTRAKYGFDADTCAVLTAIDAQSPDIAQSVDQALEVRSGGSPDQFDGIGAGDQGLMFGYAVRETPELMPLPIALAHRLAQRLTWCRKNRVLPYLRPDGKTQVTVEYEGRQPRRVGSVVVSAQHRPDVAPDKLARDLREYVIDPVMPAGLADVGTAYLINPSGRFVLGGPHADTGLTGRKIIVDTYGGRARHGGGGFSGKDPTKVDRSSAYYARYVAKNVVAAGLADECEIQVAYAIGVARPLAVQVHTFGTGVMADAELEELVNEHFDFRPAAIIRQLDLQRPIYKELAAYGHMGREDLEAPWEWTDRAAQLRRAARLDGQTCLACGVVWPDLGAAGDGA